MSIINQFYDALRRNLPLTDIVSEDITLYACEPMNKLHGIDAIKEHYWNVLSQSLDNLERRPFIEFDSIDNNHKWIAATGYFIGDFVNDLLGIPATKKPVYLRFTEMLQLQNEKIINYYIIIDCNISYYFVHITYLKSLSPSSAQAAPSSRQLLQLLLLHSGH
jgi:hypothetical protein